MDVGKFKSNRVKLTLWIMIPLFLMTGLGLSCYGLRLQSEWKLNRTKVVANILPQLGVSKQQALDLVNEFQGDKSDVVRSEDEFISFLQNAADKANFMVDSLKVDRKESAAGNMPLLVASVRGEGKYLDIETYMSDVTARQHLLTVSSLKISQSNRMGDETSCRAEITFELILFDAAELNLGGVL